MPIYIYNAKQQRITLEDKPFASGGEGAIYRITAPTAYQNYCVKLYFDQYRTHQKEQKTIFQITNPPPNLASPNFIVCWPYEVVYQTQQFAGFVMPLAYSNSQQLYVLCQTNINSNVSPIVRQKYDRTTQQGMINRFKLCVNIASAIHLIHSSLQYVLVDMKPQNILFTHDGKIAITDIDSIQISQNQNLLYNATVATPDYTPTEGHTDLLNPVHHYIPQSWDEFSLAVMFYEIILGLHPYAATFGSAYSNQNTIAEKIQNGLFVHGTKKTYAIVIPPPHQYYTKLPAALQNLFYAAFEIGHSYPQQRPTAEQWGNALYEKSKKIHTITAAPSTIKTTVPTIKTTVPTIKTTVPTIASKTPIPTNPNPTANVSQKPTSNKLGTIIFFALGLLALYLYINVHYLKETAQQEGIMPLNEYDQEVLVDNSDDKTKDNTDNTLAYAENDTLAVNNDTLKEESYSENLLNIDIENNYDCLTWNNALNAQYWSKLANKTDTDADIIDTDINVEKIHTLFMQKTQLIIANNPLKQQLQLSPSTILYEYESLAKAGFPNRAIAIVMTKPCVNIDINLWCGQSQLGCVTSDDVEIILIDTETNRIINKVKTNDYYVLSIIKNDKQITKTLDLKDYARDGVPCEFYFNSYLSCGNTEYMFVAYNYHTDKIQYIDFNLKENSGFLVNYNSVVNVPLNQLETKGVIQYEVHVGHGSDGYNIYNYKFDAQKFCFVGSRAIKKYE